MAARTTAPANTNAFPAPKTEFLDLDPPHWAARGLAYAMIAIFALGVIASVAITLPEKVTAQFMLAPARGADPVKASRGGVVSRVLASEGQVVNKGDLIITLRSEAAGDRAAELQTIQTRLAGAGESFLNARMKYNAERMADEQEIRKLNGRAEHLESLIGHKRRQLELIRQLAAGYEKLYREGLASQAQYASRQIEVSELTSEVERLVSEQRDARFEIEKLTLGKTARQTDFREYERNLKETARTGEIRATAIKSGLAGADGDQAQLAAPCAGTILKLRVKDSGAFVSEGEIVAELACGGERLVAELTVPESGVGKLKLDQSVKLKFDAFPYQRHGVSHGRLSWLSPAKSEGDAMFKARVELADKEIIVKGQPRQFAAGM
ncbi:MAG TPA: HlyD family efflux transporter periplasmic adaptor subunit, partial [Blastocatellia bacterium]|nr:HlyD family efflux transporter periplasmic adaptor subunit [Blastocatellia bacterium]